MDLVMNQNKQELVHYKTAVLLIIFYSLCWK